MQRLKTPLGLKYGMSEEMIKIRIRLGILRRLLPHSRAEFGELWIHAHPKRPTFPYLLRKENYTKPPAVVLQTQRQELY